MKKNIKKYQRKIWRGYKKEVGLLESYTYLYGNPIKVHVPIDTAENGLMIIGAYPTAHFNVIGSQTNVPVEDHLYPFSNEKYFDGSSVRCVKSGAEIEEYFLSSLNLKRSDCWITNLVKVFLFKPGHIEKYKALGHTGHKETRSMFKQIAEKSKKYIDEEIELAKPKIILGLGREVNAVMLSMSYSKAQADIATSCKVEYPLNGKIYNYFPVAHPGILMRNRKKPTDWRMCLDTSLKIAKEILAS
jgi:uracil-DNA glycosylase